MALGFQVQCILLTKCSSLDSVIWLALKSSDAIWDPNAIRVTVVENDMDNTYLCLLKQLSYQTMKQIRLLTLIMAILKHL